jgi:MFS family permease
MMYSFIGVASGLIALFSRRLIQRPDLRAITITGITLIPVSFGLMAALPGKFGLIGFFLYAIPYGLCTAVTNTLLNRQFHKGAERATFLSVVDFFQRLAASVLAIVLGWILARHGASTALYAAMAFTGVVAALLIPGTFEFGVDKERVNLLKS